MTILKGDKIYLWEVISDVMRKRTTNEGWAGNEYWNIRCNCGKEREAKRPALEALKLKGEGKGLSRACITCYRETKKRQQEDLGSYGMVYSDYASQAKRRKKEFNLTKEEAIEMFKSNCHYCGIEPSNTKISHGTKNKYFIFYQGIDRVDPKKNYEIGNILPCCKMCNYAKRDMTYNEFITWIEKVYNNKVQRLGGSPVGSSDSKWKTSELETEDGDIV